MAGSKGSIHTQTSPDTFPMPGKHIANNKPLMSAAIIGHRARLDVFDMVVASEVML